MKHLLLVLVLGLTSSVFGETWWLTPRESVAGAIATMDDHKTTTEEVMEVQFTRKYIDSPDGKSTAKTIPFLRKNYPDLSFRMVGFLSMDEHDGEVHALVALTSKSSVGSFKSNTYIYSVTLVEEGGMWKAESSYPVAMLYKSTWTMKQVKAELKSYGFESKDVDEVEHLYR